MGKLSLLLTLAMELSLLHVDGQQGRQQESIDDVFASAGNFLYGINQQGRRLDDEVRTLNGEAVYTDLDIVELAPCELNSERIELSDRGITTFSSHIPYNTEIRSDGPPGGDGYCAFDEGFGGFGGGEGGEGGIGGGFQEFGNGNGEFENGFDFQARRKRNVLRNPKSRWPSKTIAYEYDLRFNFTDLERENFEKAIEDYNNYTCIRFVPRTEEPIYLRIIKDTGCYSYVGLTARATNGQEVSLALGCLFSKRISIHELFHALGSYHQQSRPDRDDFVIINLSKVRAGFESNFNKISATTVDTFNTVYSYRSVMHYGRTAFSKDGSNTITTKDATFQDIIGRGPTFSFEDLVVVNSAYNCDSNCISQPNNCPTSPKSYRDTNCNCLCKNDDINPEVPAIPCDAVAPCTMIGTNCSCSKRPSACEALENAECLAPSDGCRCKAMHVLHGSPPTCTLLSTISCTSLNTDCKCTMRGGNASCTENLPNSVCVMDRCQCAPDFEETESGTCKSQTANCTTIDTPCNCSMTQNSCDYLNNTVCNTTTNACECNPPLVAVDQPLVCEDLSNIECDMVGVDCACSLRGGNTACAPLPNTTCDNTTNTCNCIDNLEVINGMCTPVVNCSKVNQMCSCNGTDGACDGLNNTECMGDACVCLSGFVLVNNSCISSIPCETVGMPCLCHATPGEPCENLTNTMCDGMSEACVCLANHVLFGMPSVCTSLDDIICNVTSEDCQCTLKGPTACDELDNTECNNSTNQCECIADFMLKDGECTQDIACTKAGVDCMCSMGGETACGNVGNSTCSTTTNACECNEDFFLEDGQCVQAAECRAVGVPCHCEVRGNDACSSLSSTECNAFSGSCDCLTGYTLSGGLCIREASFCTNGRSVSPFISSMAGFSSTFAPVKSLEAPTNLFGVPRNGYVLHASGIFGSQAGIVTPALGPGRWCVQFGTRLLWAAILVEFSNDNFKTAARTGIGSFGSYNSRRYYSRAYAYTGSSADFKIRLRGLGYPFDYRKYRGYRWYVFLDPVKVRLCNTIGR